MILAPLAAVACGTTYSSPPPATSTGDLEGSRYETMRVLAGRLVDRLQGTRDELRASREAESEMSTLATLIEKARRFRDQLENYSNPPRYVRDDVNELDRIARDMESRTRNVQVSTRAYDNWRGALDVLDRMQRLLAGQDVDIPPASGPSTGSGGSTYPTYPTYPSTGGTYGSVLSGTALEDFRRTAHEVVVRGTLARDTAERSGTTYNDTDRRLVSDLSYFLSQARDLDSRAMATSVDRRDVRPLVERLSDDARRLDSGLRSSSAFSRSSSDWAEVMRGVQRLLDLTR
ncbi:MAG: hypothetical protein ABI610_10530 [Acidobacteriota bacterium]